MPERQYLMIPAGSTPANAWGNIWWNEAEPTRIHLTTTDFRFNGAPGGSGPGLHVIFEGVNQDSANFDPAKFNRCARALADAGMNGPEPVPELPRRINQRTLSFHPKVMIGGVEYVPKVT